MSVWPESSLSDGTDQEQRFPPALEPGYFLPEERRFEDLLALGLELARTLPFRDLGNKRKGTWGDLFTANEAVIVAHILSTDTLRLKSEFAKECDKGVEHAARFAYRTARRISFWLSKLGSSRDWDRVAIERMPDGTEHNRDRARLELSERIEALVRARIVENLRALEDIVDILRETSPSLDDLDFGDFDRRLRIDQPGSGAGFSRSAMTQAPDPRDLPREVRRIFASFLNVIAHLRSVVRPYLDESLQSQKHEPAIALFMVFLKLLETTSHKLNKFTERHLDFYYHRVLGAIDRQHKPDHLFFSLRTAERQGEVLIPAGTELVTSAGEEGGDIGFASERNVVLSDAKVETLCTIRFERDAFISPEIELGYVTRIKALQRDVGHAGVSTDAPSSWPLFGTSSRLAGHESAQDGRVGFAVASPVLLLREGRRTITVRIELGDPGDLSHGGNEIQQVSEPKDVQDRAKLLTEMFAEYLSVEWDWIEATASAHGEQPLERPLSSVEEEAIENAVGARKGEKSLAELFRRIMRTLVSNVTEEEIESAFRTAQKGRSSIRGLFLRGLLRQPIESRETLHRLFGMAFRYYTVTSGEGVDERLTKRLNERAGALLGADAQKVVEQALGLGRAQLSLIQIFAEYLCAEWGWFEAVAIEGADNRPKSRASNAEKVGFENTIEGIKKGGDFEDDLFLATLLRLVGSVKGNEIETAFETARETRGSIYPLFLKALTRHPMDSVETFHSLLGTIFRYYVLTSNVAMDAQFRQELNERAKTLLGADSHSQKVLAQLLGLGREGIFQKLLKDVFDIYLTVPDGWHRIDNYVATQIGAESDGPSIGLQFLLDLGPNVDPIVSYSPEIHGGQWAGSSPMIRFELNPRATFCAYSLLNAWRLDAIVVDVDVRGLRDLMLFNNVGRIDPSKPFQPFGPLPTLSSYFAFGSYEMAQKQLTKLTLNLDWADLPTCFAGFAAHYGDYERIQGGDDFRGDLSALQDAVWQPQRQQERRVVPLFEATGPTDKLKAAHSIAMRGVLDFFRPIDPKFARDQFDPHLGVRNGFFRLGLSGPEGAFGHADYPSLLSSSLSENIRSKKAFKKVPNAPYTPLISQLSVDYRARAKIRVNETRSGQASQRTQRVFHLHPFGYEEVEPTRTGRSFSLLPRYDTDGNLFIGVNGGRGAQELALLFHLTEETNQQTSFESPRIVWYYLGIQGWCRIPATSFVSDTTNGFLSSGVVVLTLPKDVDRRSTLMPSGKAWLRVGADTRLDSFPRLYSVHTNGIRASRRIDPAARETHTELLPTACKWETAVSVAGLAEVVQIGGAYGGVPTENPRRFRTRISERLRHKNRAITAWDFERLVLERFPDVFKVKCFEGLDTTEAEPKPGHLLVVVVPFVGGGGGLQCQRPMLDVLRLKEILRFVEQVSSTFVKVEVRNPLYERIQVRCKAMFADGANPGSHIRTLNREVSEFLCPWIPLGHQAKFGWTIKREEVEDFIRARNYVKFVTDFSMLQITEDEQDQYTLVDTVSRKPVTEYGGNLERDGQSTHLESNQVRWRYPWSLAVPMEHHFIEAMRVPLRTRPEPTGIGELGIGGTFIISGAN